MASPSFLRVHVLCHFSVGLTESPVIPVRVKNKTFPREDLIRPGERGSCCDARNGTYQAIASTIPWKIAS